MKLLLILLLAFIKQCLLISLMDYLAKKDTRIARQLMRPNMSNHSDVMFNIQGFNINFRRLIDKIHLQNNEKLKQYAITLKSIRGPIFSSYMVVKNILVGRYNWTEEEVTYLVKCMNDTSYLRQRFFEVYNSSKWFPERRNITVPLTFPARSRRPTRVYCLDESTDPNCTDYHGPRIRVPPFNRGKPFTPANLIIPSYDRLHQTKSPKNKSITTLKN